MDLVAGVRKEGSRGGRAEFKWEDVKDSQHRENYLGHSLMAPVGRWQANRDLSWYAKNNHPPGSDAAASAAEARRAELRAIKEAEQDALSEALGYGPMPKRRKEDAAAGGNANLEPLGAPGGVGRKDLERAVREGGIGEDNDGMEGRGIGFGGFGGADSAKMPGGERDVLIGDDRMLEQSRGEEKQRERRRERSRDRGAGKRDGSRERKHRRDEGRRGEERRHHRHHRHRSRDRDGDRRVDRRERHGDGDGDRDRNRDRDRERERYRSRSYERKRRRSRSQTPDRRRRSRSRDRDRDWGYERRR